MQNKTKNVLKTSKNHNPVQNQQQRTFHDVGHFEALKPKQTKDIR